MVPSRHTVFLISGMNVTLAATAGRCPGQIARRLRRLRRRIPLAAGPHVGAAGRQILQPMSPSRHSAGGVVICGAKVDQRSPLGRVLAFGARGACGATMSSVPAPRRRGEYISGGTYQGRISTGSN